MSARYENVFKYLAEERRAERSFFLSVLVAVLPGSPDAARTWLKDATGQVDLKKFPNLSGEPGTVAIGVLERVQDWGDAPGGESYLVRLLRHLEEESANERAQQRLHRLQHRPSLLWLEDAPRIPVLYLSCATHDGAERAWAESFGTQLIEYMRNRYIDVEVEYSAPETLYANSWYTRESEVTGVSDLGPWPTLRDWDQDRYISPIYSASAFFLLHSEAYINADTAERREFYQCERAAIYRRIEWLEREVRGVGEKMSQDAPLFLIEVNEVPTSIAEYENILKNFVAHRFTFWGGSVPSGRMQEVAEGLKHALSGRTRPTLLLWWDKTETKPGQPDKLRDIMSKALSKSAFKNRILISSNNGKLNMTNFGKSLRQNSYCLLLNWKSDISYVDFILQSLDEEWKNRCLKDADGNCLQKLSCKVWLIKPPPKDGILFAGDYTIVDTPHVMHENIFTEDEVLSLLNTL